MHKIKFYTRALKFEREFVWPVVGPVTFQQLAITIITWLFSFLFLLIFIPGQLAFVGGFIWAVAIWFLYGAIKPDGKKIHRFCMDVIRFWVRDKKKNMGESIKDSKIKERKWIRVQE